jgi:hypothetical protein
MLSAVWPVWSGSVKGEVRFEPMSRKDAASFLRKALAWDARTHEKGKHGGIIGHVGRAMIRALIDFLNFKSGRCDPSLDSLARKTGYCKRAAQNALKLLRRLGMLEWLRRCEDSYDEAGNFRLRQRTNAYRLTPPSQWVGYEEDEPPPLPSPDTLGMPEPVPEPLEAAVAAFGDHDKVMAALTLDPHDKLAMALASIGRHFSRVARDSMKPSEDLST